MAIDALRRSALFERTVIPRMVAITSDATHAASSWPHLSTSDLRAVVTRLPPAIRNTFLRWCDGRSYQEISREFGIPVSTVATRVWRTKRAIREAERRGEGR
jgi:DNA-directed RNA polymerase specialized sigma24 family protein